MEAMTIFAMIRQTNVMEKEGALPGGPPAVSYRQASEVTLGAVADMKVWFSVSQSRQELLERPLKHDLNTHHLDLQASHLILLLGSL